jgi:hypothetical protein
MDARREAVGIIPGGRATNRLNHGTRALVAIHTSGKAQLPSPETTTTLTVPWMTKWSSAGAQIVGPPTSKR